MYITFFVPEIDPAVEAENKRLKEEKKAQKAMEKEMSPIGLSRKNSQPIQVKTPTPSIDQPSPRGTQ